MSLRILFLIIGFLIVSLCCGRLFESQDEELTLARKPYMGNALRMDGYYYMLDKDGLMTVYFYYRNGIVLHGGDFAPSKLAEKEEMYRNGQDYLISKQYKDVWGVFQIDSTAIKFEKWYPADSYFAAFIRMGEILNDTTFHISKSQRSDGTEQRDKDETYHFKQFSPKPDSICPFIP